MHTIDRDGGQTEQRDTKSEQSSECALGSFRSKASGEGKTARHSKAPQIFADLRRAPHFKVTWKRLQRMTAAALVAKVLGRARRETTAHGFCGE